MHISWSLVLRSQAPSMTLYHLELALEPHSMSQPVLKSRTFEAIKFSICHPSPGLRKLYSTYSKLFSETSRVNNQKQHTKSFL